MRTLLLPNELEMLLARVNALTGNESRLWGKMTEAQMLQHCRKQIEMAVGKIPSKPVYPKPIQWLAKMTFGYYIPWPKNLITAPEMVAGNDASFPVEHEKLLILISEFLRTERLHPHPIFGTMTKEEWGMIIYKHVDHHLRQFGA